MRQTLCPKCDSILTRSGHCTICGYQVKNTCPKCGHLNIPTAKYCGGCGIGTTTSIRCRKIYNGFFNPFQQLKLKKFFAGIAFGTLLSLFAFGSLGMKSVDRPISDEPIIPVMDESLLNSAVIKNLNSDLDNFCLERDLGKDASAGEINAVLDILIRNLNHLAERTNKSKFPLESANEYLEQQRSLKVSDDPTRGNCAMLFFAYATDLLELKYKDYTQENSYDDIPRFHFMDAPTTALKKNNVNLAASKEHFGINDPVKLETVCEAARELAMTAVHRADIIAPDLTAPPEIIIE